MPSNTPKSVTVYKKLGQTPLEALEAYRTEIGLNKEIPMTYAGRLDPMAEGLLIILIGEECKNKEKYLGLDKEYEVELVFGIETDSYDALGLAMIGPNSKIVKASNLNDFILPDLSKYHGKFTQEYPPYSSKTFDGKQLHELARSGELPNEMPTKEVEIYEIEDIGKREISADELLARVVSSIDLVKGDFRQDEIKQRWNMLFNDKSIFDRKVVKTTQVSKSMFPTLKLRVKCSSGTYMRSLAHRMGKDVGTGAFALSIKRTKIVARIQN